MKSVSSTHLPLLLVLLAVVSGCSRPEAQYAAENQLKPVEQSRFIRSIIRYTGRLAPGATYENRFDSRFDEAYRELAARHRLDFYFADATSGRHYFVVSRPAPSVAVKRVAIGGFVIPGDTTVNGYAEVFRTWKMAPDTLKRRSLFLFEKMIAGEDLSPWYTQNSGGVEYIEFPDAETRFDPAGRRWISSRALPEAGM